MSAAISPSKGTLLERIRTDPATPLFDGEGNRKVLIRMINGSQLLSDHFLIQIKFWGIARILAFVSQPPTNGVAERFYRTLKEQIIY
jgi:hypothetical protein